MDLARLLSQARASLAHGEWTRLWSVSGGASPLPFSKRKGEMLVTIGQVLGKLNAQNEGKEEEVFVQ